MEILVDGQTYRRKIMKLDALEKALRDMIDVSGCKNGCKKSDMSCATRRAERALKLKD